MIRRRAFGLAASVLGPTKTLPMTDRIFALIDEHPDDEPLILLAALSVLWLKPQNPDAEILLRRYHSRGFSLEALRETALQLFLLAGFQASLEAMFQIRDVLGISLPFSGDEPQMRDVSALQARGRELQAKVYRENTDRLRANLHHTSPELAEWTVSVGYGLVLSRSGLMPHWRELLEVALLAAQGFPRQLHSHLRGAINLGASISEVELALKVAETLSEPEQSASAWQVWLTVKKSVCQTGRLE
jgi:4-carboxymuconolactone decarboxylase